MEICGVKFTDQKQFEAVKASIHSSMIEGFKPTKESVEHIKAVLDGKMTMEQLAEFHKQNEKNMYLNQNAFSN
ncbi:MULTISPECIES: antitoxin VbhA family protein [Siminovitchia]|uniref:Antitoxin VbhA family protein n=1 Tax=Siminovitchia sediminis TaxID=1274353 RepID=A0ABW4KBQ5_9BACI|nr:antitoxin VbhA family protein [Siminovitchia fortis]